MQLYHRIGIEIQQRQGAEGWGAKVIERVALDLKDVFPDIRGFSSRNLKYGLLRPVLPRLHLVTLLAGELNTGSKVE